jgi:hypothetical protein
VSSKLLPTWARQQLALVIEANALSEPVCTLEQYGKIFEALIQETNTRNAVFATLGARSSSPSSHSCPCKESRTEKHPWPPSECSLLELAIKGTTENTPDPLPTEAQLQEIHERLVSRSFASVHGYLERKGWVIKGGGVPKLLGGTLSC